MIFLLFYFIVFCTILSTVLTKAIYEVLLTVVSYSDDVGVFNVTCDADISNFCEHIFNAGWFGSTKLTPFGFSDCAIPYTTPRQTKIQIITDPYQGWIHNTNFCIHVSSAKIIPKKNRAFQKDIFLNAFIKFWKKCVDFFFYTLKIIRRYLRDYQRVFGMNKKMFFFLVVY